MKQSGFADNEIGDTPKRSEAGLPIPDLFRKFGIGTATFDE